MADIIGIELAMAFATYWAKDCWQMWLARWQSFCERLAAAVTALALSLPFERRSFSVLCSFSLILVLLGAPALAMIGWYPWVFLSPWYGGYS